MSFWLRLLEESSLVHIVYMIAHNLFIRDVHVYKPKWLCRVKNIAYFRQSMELYLIHNFYNRKNMLKFEQLCSSENKRALTRVAKCITIIMIQF